jgi:hypothetical protein
VKMITPCAKHIEVLLTKNKNLLTTRDMLLHNLITGVIDVSEYQAKVSEITE